MSRSAAVATSGNIGMSESRGTFAIVIGKVLKTASALRGNLHDDGHGKHHGLGDRSDGFLATRCGKRPSVVAEHARLGTQTGRRAVDMAWEELKPSTFLTSESIDNALMTSFAIGGSTNAIVHLIAIAGRLGMELTLDR